MKSKLVFEVPIFDESHNEVTCFDIVLAADELFYLIEVKSNKKQIYASGTREKLSKAYDIIHCNFGIEPIMLLALGKEVK